MAWHECEVTVVSLIRTLDMFDFLAVSTFWLLDVRDPLLFTFIRRMGVVSALGITGDEEEDLAGERVDVEAVDTVVGGDGGANDGEGGACDGLFVCE